MAFFCSQWVDVSQALSVILGTWLLAFGLKSIKETGGKLDTADRHPCSWRFWAGLVLLTLAAVPPLLSPFLAPCVEYPVAIGTTPTKFDIGQGAIILLTGALVWVTYTYTKHTARIVEEMRGQSQHTARMVDRPYLYITYERLEWETGMHYYRLLLKNTGNRIAHDVKIEVIDDAYIGSHRAQLAQGQVGVGFVRVSDTGPCREGVHSLVPGDVVELGFYQRSQFTEGRSEQRLVYRLLYKDGAGFSYEEQASTRYPLS